MRKISLFGVATIMMLAGIAAWASSSHSAVKTSTGRPDVTHGECKEFAQPGNAQFEDVVR